MTDTNYDLQEILKLSRKMYRWINRVARLPKQQDTYIDTYAVGADEARELVIEVKGKLYHRKKHD